MRRVDAFECNLFGVSRILFGLEAESVIDVELFRLEIDPSWEYICAISARLAANGCDS